MSKLLKSSGVFAIMTFASRVLGLIRDIIIARYFNTSDTDVFFVALRIPNTLRRFFAEGGFANAFVPVLNETKESQSESELQSLINHVFGVLGFILLIITGLGIIFSGYLITSGFTDRPEQQALATTMLRITFPYIFFISLTAFFAGILNTYQKFALPAFIPALLNISLIVAALYFQDYFNPPVLVLAWAVFVGGLLQFAVQIPVLWRLKRFPIPKISFAHRGVRKVLKLMLPTLLGSSVGQINILLNTLLASLMVTGSVSWLYYSDRLVELPVAIIGVALGTVILPKLSALKANLDDGQFTQTLSWAVRLALIVGLASATGLLMLAYPLISTLFQRGEFADFDAVMAAKSLRIFALGAFALVMIKVLAPGFYSRQDTKTPVKIGIFCIIINIMISLSLFKLMGHVGLAVASTVAAFINMGLLATILTKKGCLTIDRGFLFFVGKVVIANLIMGLCLMLCYQYLLQGNEWKVFSQSKRIYYLTVLIFIGLGSYIFSLWLLRIKLRQLLRI